MGSKLSREEELLSIQAVSEYKRENFGTNKKTVIVYKDNSVIFNSKISVIAGDHNIYLEIDIIWEDAKFDFKDYGLYGGYSTTYTRMVYKNDSLTIDAGDGISIIIV